VRVVIKICRRPDTEILSVIELIGSCGLVDVYRNSSSGYSVMLVGHQLRRFKVKLGAKTASVRPVIAANI